MNIFHPDYREEFRGTRYPFVPSATLKSPELTLPIDVIIDAHLYPLNGNSRYYLSEIRVSQTSVVFVIGDDRSRQLAEGVYPLDGSKNLVALKSSGDTPAGVLLIDTENAASLSGLPLGNYAFDTRSTEFCVKCHVPITNNGLTGFLLPDGQIVSGEVWLYGEDGVILSVEDDNEIHVNVVGDPLFLQKFCDEIPPRMPIKLIRVKHDTGEYYCNVQHGSFTIQVNNDATENPALRVTGNDQGLYIWMAGTPA